MEIQVACQIDDHKTIGYFWIKLILMEDLKVSQIFSFLRSYLIPTTITKTHDSPLLPLCQCYDRGLICLDANTKLRKLCIYYLHSQRYAFFQPLLLTKLSINVKFYHKISRTISINVKFYHKMSRNVNNKTTHIIFVKCMISNFTFFNNAYCIHMR